MEKIRVNKQAAAELAFVLAREAAKKDGEISRDAWLWAYRRYDFSEANPFVQRRLKALARHFEQLLGRRGEITI